MTDLETAIMIKNMARGMVKALAAKNSSSQEAFADLMKNYNQYREKWIKAHGSEKGFDEWFTNQVKKSGAAKNAIRGAEVTYQTDDGKTGSYRTSINGTDAEIKEYFKPGKKINIGDGGAGPHGNDKIS